MSERRRSAGSWLGGVRSAGVDIGYPGEKMGLPAEGVDSVGGYGRRLLALFADWLLCTAVAWFAAVAWHWSPQSRSMAALVIFGVVVWLLTALTGTTLGKRLCGLRVARLDGRPVGLLWSFVRTLLLVLVIPALLWDRDFRGLHDRAANTVVLRI